MQIYKCTHIESGKCYIGQTIQSVDRCKYEHLSHSKHSKKTYHFHNALRKDGGPMKGKTCSEEHKRKVSLANKGKFKNKTWKLIDGKRVWMEAE
jgi:hypothetical protein